MKRNFSLILLFILLMTGCAGPARYVDPETDEGPVAMTLDYRDFERAASESVDSLLASGAVDNPNGGRYVLVVSRIINDTMQRLDTDQLVKRIRTELLNSGRVATTTAVGIDGPEDEMNMLARTLRDSEEFDQRGVERKGTLQAPDLSLSGKILQRNHRVGREQQVEYYLQLSLTDLTSGLAIWENETRVIKRGPNDSVTW
ncbi:penicillin-binding protein activator LpoB [Ectothiorhodospira mobilis]|uniref:penicillin-binding protein activator LpoB n=1 Tax=Ectothiorhodospira mobilis TaxID=195064 RepID=UPI001EE80B4E|nr:penicillin-binding protein activator LpoB [Ectothiorhodospira mobilis]MCG5535594.1 penicillin-binding protein activator LpoB [Ectothiorhodospira mobilis]